VYVVTVLVAVVLAVVILVSLVRVVVCLNEQKPQDLSQ
jgi:hypothetical protein